MKPLCFPTSQHLVTGTLLFTSAPRHRHRHTHAHSHSHAHTQRHTRMHMHTHILTLTDTDTRTCTCACTHSQISHLRLSNLPRICKSFALKGLKCAFLSCPGVRPGSSLQDPVPHPRSTYSQDVLEVKWRSQENID
uniref:Uncharacterized protein n=1 Tax=Myotis myotis TaxID=51298 RepID=A0A7J7RMM8_MYOMY|nr:hypothetical protein mMyoMyo1_010266 [Myotis myotis]